MRVANRRGFSPVAASSVPDSPTSTAAIVPALLLDDEEAAAIAVGPHTSAAPAPAPAWRRPPSRYLSLSIN
jgi:hypothetical protein